MKIGTLDQVWRYPVKSMAGETLESVMLDASGMRGDRAWALRDEVRGGIRGAKKLPGLMQLGARYLEDPGAGGSSPAEILFPDGTRGSTQDDDIHQRITAAIDNRVSLWPLMPAEDLEHYRRGAPSHTDMTEELRSIFGREEGEPLPDLSMFPPDLLIYESPPGTYFDVSTLLLLTSDSLATLQGRAPESLFDVRRFRPNLLIKADGSEDPFPELAWRQRKIRIGEATIQVGTECPRCVMTTQKTEDLPDDPQVMRKLVKEADGNLGVYASVIEPGRVAAGDRVESID